MRRAERFSARLPWEAQPEDATFRRWVLGTSVAATLGAIVLALAPTPSPPVVEAPVASERIARLLLPPPPRPEPPPPVPEPRRPEPVRPAPPEVEPPQVAEVVPAPAEPPPQAPEIEAPASAAIAEAEPVVDRAAQARAEAEVAGLMPLADALASLRDNASLGAVSRAQARHGAVGAAQRSERSVIARDLAADSGGVRTAEVSRDTSASGLASRDTTRVTSTAGAAGAGSRGRLARSAVEAPDRSREEIELVFDRNKGAIHALYDRALRQNPSLEGKLVLQLTIEPSGEISGIEILSSELDDAELEARLMQRIRLFRFEARDVAPVITTKPLDFFPV